MYMYELVYKTKKIPQRPVTPHFFFSFSGNQLHPLNVHSTCSHPVLGFDQLDFSATWAGVEIYHHLGVSSESICVQNLQCRLWHMVVCCFLGSRLNVDSIQSLGPFLPAPQWFLVSTGCKHQPWEQFRRLHHYYYSFRSSRSTKLAYSKNCKILPLLTVPPFYLFHWQNVLS